jgi:DNA-binding NtrC family response regulator
MSDVKIMLVDDEERFLTTTQKLLKKKGYDYVEIALSGQEALEKLTVSNIQVIILDVKMPGMDGVTTLREIKRMYPLVEVIMLTGNATVDSAIAGLKSGAFDYLMKPADIDELMEKVEEAYDKRRQLEEKIRMAEFRKSMKSPREILKQSEGTE